MGNYFDKDNKKLRKGFYLDTNKKYINYFTGKYTPDENPIFQDEEKLDNSHPLISTYVSTELVRLTRKETEIKLKELKQKTNWLENKLKK